MSGLSSNHDSDCGHSPCNSSRVPARAPEEAGIEASGNRRLLASQELQPDESDFVEVIEIEQEEVVLEVARRRRSDVVHRQLHRQARDAAPRLCAHPRPALRSLLSHASLVPHCPRSVGLARGRLTSRGSAHDANVGVWFIVFSVVLLIPNTHTGPGAGRWEGGGVQTSGRYNL